MKKKISLMMSVLSLMTGSFAFTACGDDDDDGDEGVIDTVVVKDLDDSIPKRVTVSPNYVVMADLMGIKWTDTVYLSVDAQTGLIAISMSGASMPQDSYRIADAKLENVVIKDGMLSNAGEDFVASVALGAAAGAPMKVYSTKDEDAKLSFSSFSGVASNDTFNLSLEFKAGKMPVTVPLTITSIAN